MPDKEKLTEPFMKYRISVALYCLLRNDHVWSMLSEKKKQMVLKRNQEHNVFREDYFDPLAYADGRNFDTLSDRNETIDGIWIKNFLNDYNPGDVIEYGPGSGYYTRTIVDHPSVKNYYAVDINNTFLEFLSEKLEKFHVSKSDFEFEMFNCDFKEVGLSGIDAAIFMNSVHHIPNRTDLFVEIAKQIRIGGKVVCIEPAHYYYRYLRMINKMRDPDFFSEIISGSTQISTHHMCSLGEFKKVSRQTGAFKIVDFDFFSGEKSLTLRVINKIANILQVGKKNYLRRTFFHKILSRKIMVVFERV